jgi:Family of unknown function (DUF6519)
MQGEFRGDFTRDTFSLLNPRRYSRVFMQQGRVQLDADWNEQVSILLDYLRNLAGDLIGPYGGPKDNCGFEITVGDEKKDLKIGKGRYYVNGIFCENFEEDLTYGSQLGFPFQESLKLNELTKGSYLVFLDVWERHITYAQADPYLNIREVALNGPDTATRGQVVYQVKIQKTTSTADEIKNPKDYLTWLNFLKIGDKKAQVRPGGGLLAARAKRFPSDSMDEPCIISPQARYRGPENQLYRVEVHRPGQAWDQKPSNLDSAATFKWSRENSSITFPVVAIAGSTVILADLGRESRLSLNVGDWVEIIDTLSILQNRADPLLQVVGIEPATLEVQLSDPPVIQADEEKAALKNILLRRWDHKKVPKKQGSELSDGAIPIQEGTGEDGWLNLEDGIQIQFQLGKNTTYCTGDYWLIPARTATADVEWQQQNGQPVPLQPHGVEHHYAPLAIVKVDNGKLSDGVADLRRIFGSLSVQIP